MAVGEAAANRAPKISRMGEMGGRERRSEATAERHCLGLRVRGRDGLRSRESTVRGGK